MTQVALQLVSLSFVLYLFCNIVGELVCCSIAYTYDMLAGYPGFHV